MVMFLKSEKYSRNELTSNLGNNLSDMAIVSGMEKEEVGVCSKWRDMVAMAP